MRCDDLDAARQELAVLSAPVTTSHSTWSDDCELVAVAWTRIAARLGDPEASANLLAEALGDAGDACAAALLRLELAGILQEHDPAEAQRLAENAAACAARLQALPLRDRAARLLAVPSVATPP